MWIAHMNGRISFITHKKLSFESQKLPHISYKTLGNKIRKFGTRCNKDSEIQQQFHKNRQQCCASVIQCSIVCLCERGKAMKLFSHNICSRRRWETLGWKTDKCRDRWILSVTVHFKVWNFLR